MSESEQANPESANASEQTGAPDKVRKLTNILVISVVVIFLFSVIADRIIPITDNARVKGYIVPIKPEVSGTVLDIVVQPNQLVNQGDSLALLDPADYRIAVRQAEQNLEIAGQNVGAQTANVAAAQARLTSAMVEQANTQQQASRVLAMADKGVVSRAEADNARAALASAKAGVSKAQADLEQAKQQMGQQGEENSQVKAALLALEQAQLNLERTVIKAPTQGGVSNFSLSEGFYASAGQAIMTFVSIEDIWIEAYFRENSLGNVTVGDEVEVALDFAPGKVVKGRVTSIDWGIDWGQSNQAGKLAQASEQTGWLRQTQMLPITIQFERDEVRGLLRIGGQADVIVYSGDNWLFNAFGKVWIRLLSLFSYVR